MKLSVKDRFALLNLLPTEGNIMTIRSLTKLRSELGFSDKEIKKIGMVSAEGSVTWEDKDYVKDVEFGEIATEIVKDSLTKSNNESKLTAEMIPLYEAFIEGGTIDKKESKGTA